MAGGTHNTKLFFFFWTRRMIVIWLKIHSHAPLPRYALIDSILEFLPFVINLVFFFGKNPQKWKKKKKKNRKLKLKIDILTQYKSS
jgi:hypothetical protein